MGAECRYILLDVGGTSIKCAAADQNGIIKAETMVNFPSRSNEKREVIFDNFAAIICEMAEKTDGLLPAGIGMAFPGPFDYEQGISRIRGLDKYESIYEIPIVPELLKRVSWLKDVPFRFLHDVEAFAIGVGWFGLVKDTKKFMCLCIGTGTGSAFVKGKKVLKQETGGVPLHGWLYSTPYKDSVIDDYLSVRGLERLGKNICGESLDGYELMMRCQQKDEKAMAVFRAFGTDLKNAMVPFLDEFKPEAVVMGGQISKSFSWFGGEFEDACECRGIKVYMEPETSIRAMQGLYVSMEKGV